MLEAIVARRKELKTIASGLLGSFISRNNDVAGYWGVGQLSLLAHQNSTHTVHIDLLANTISPPSALFSKLISGYFHILHRHISARGIPLSWLSSAVIELNLGPELPSKHVPITTWGSLFKVTVAIADDKGARHAVSGFGYCAAHNPKKESRSTGTERF